MAITEMSLPIDIPWKRLGVSRDMIDNDADDNVFPHNWRSSIAVFYHEPTELPPEYCKRKITYLKVVCTITNFEHENTPALNLEEEMTAPADDGVLVIKGFLKNSIDAAYPCYGALAHVSVFPNPKEGVSIEDFPYISSFEPRTRELYEAMTESGEVLSQSQNQVNVGNQLTSTQSGEEYDLDTGSSSSWGTSSSRGSGSVDSWNAAFGLASGSKETSSQSSNSSEGAKSNTGQWGTISRQNRHEQNISSIDASREKRESTSHSTSLKHIYSTLQGYHLGTNRALFFMQPRPHIQNQKFTFSQGPRGLEGIQEFFLIVNRPADVPGLCVDVRLETAHLYLRHGHVPRFINWSQLFEGDNLRKTAYALYGDESMGNPYYRSAAIVWNQSTPQLRKLILDDFTGVGQAFATPHPHAWAIEFIAKKNSGISYIEDVAIIYEDEESDSGSFFVTGRRVRSCLVGEAESDESLVDVEKSRPSNVFTDSVLGKIVYTQEYSGLGASNAAGRSVRDFSASEHNNLLNQVQSMLRSSVDSPKRIKGGVGLLETDFLIKEMTHLLNELTISGATESGRDEAIRQIAAEHKIQGIGALSGLDLRSASTPKLARLLNVGREEALRIHGKLLRESLRRLNLKKLNRRGRVADREATIRRAGLSGEEVKRILDGEGFSGTKIDYVPPARKDQGGIEK